MTSQCTKQPPVRPTIQQLPWRLGLPPVRPISRAVKSEGIWRWCDVVGGYLSGSGGWAVLLQVRSISDSVSCITQVVKRCLLSNSYVLLKLRMDS